MYTDMWDNLLKTDALIFEGSRHTLQEFRLNITDWIWQKRWVLLIGEKIKNLRVENHITQNQLAKEFHVTAQAVSKWEKGLAYPDIELLIHIADFFDVTVDYLLRDWIYRFLKFCINAL